VKQAHCVSRLPEVKSCPTRSVSAAWADWVSKSGRKKKTGAEASVFDGDRIGDVLSLSRGRSGARQRGPKRRFRRTLRGRDRWSSSRDLERVATRQGRDTITANAAAIRKSGIIAVFRSSVGRLRRCL
jgi:hypothetical protein